MEKIETENGSWSRCPEAGDPDDIFRFLQVETGEEVVVTGPDDFDYPYHVLIATDTEAVLQRSRTESRIPRLLRLQKVGNVVEMYVVEERNVTTYIGNMVSARVHP